MKKVAIIGAGVSGMTAAIYCLRSGFDVRMYEQHSVSGGLCTSWTRKGYTFEGAVHWLTNANPDAPLYRLWRDTGILGEGIQTRRDDPYLTFNPGQESAHSGQICLCRDLAKLKKHLLEIAPEDAKAIQKLCRDVKAFIPFQMPVMDIRGVKVKHKSKVRFSAIAKMFPALIRMGRLTKMSTEEYAARFKHPGIRKVLSELVIPPEYNSMGLISTMATFANDGVFPEGGALALTKRMENRVSESGGQIVFNTRVEKIIVENGEAKGILVNGKQEIYDSVIITADIIPAQNLFDTPPADKWIQEAKTKKSTLCTFAGIGVRGNLSDLPRTININEKITAGGIDHDCWMLLNYSGRPGYAPDGCAMLTTAFMGDTYDFWKRHKQAGTYDQQKKSLADAIAGMLEKHIPKIKGKIDVIDIATPLTYERYTGSWRGAFMSVTGKNDTFSMPEPICAKIKKICFAGFRTMGPGGLPVALYSGFRAAQYVCRDNDAVFEGNDKS